MKRCTYLVLLYLSVLTALLDAETVRSFITGTVEVDLNNPSGTSLSLSYNSSIIITLHRDLRFIRGIELQITAPPEFLSYQQSLAFMLYSELGSVPQLGITDVAGRQIVYELLPNKIQNIYQIPLRNAHGLRTTPYISVLTAPVLPSSFPLLFRFMPVMKGLTEEFESLVFQVHVKPILSNEGALQISFKYPQHLSGRPFTVLIDDQVIDDPSTEQIVQEGEHHLIVVSEDYRNENIRFLIERGQTHELTIELHDTTPLLIFEAPANVAIYLDNVLLGNTAFSYPVEPGTHEVKFQINDYSVLKSLVVQRGKTYHVTLTIDVQISENY
ncbi:MAG: PEGA domain-containing protein [Spirochaetaceae bacterium]|jgi:hypothetical protein|nr:PEGA domain-containing protein [Spirochaetaceae bacterium]